MKKPPQHTVDDLKIMQAWPLWKKIQVTQTRIMEWYYRHNGKVYVSISGGKDSCVLADLARRCFPDIKMVFVDTGLEFKSVREVAINTPNVTVLKPAMRFDEVVRVHGFCFPSKDVSHTLYYARKGSKWANDRLNGVDAEGLPNKYRQSHYAKWKFLLDAPFIISDKCCDVMKKDPFILYEKETGNRPIVGTMAEESQRRKSAWLQTGCNSFDSKRPTTKPISFWTTQNILQYIREYNIPIASCYGDIVEDKKGKLCTTGESRTGCIFWCATHGEYLGCGNQLWGLVVANH